jgi:hypothetical protein
VSGVEQRQQTIIFWLDNKLFWWCLVEIINNNNGKPTCILIVFYFIKFTKFILFSNDFFISNITFIVILQKIFFILQNCARWWMNEAILQYSHSLTVGNFLKSFM